MFAIVKTNNSVELLEVDRPRIDFLNDVLIKVKYAGICRTDLNIASGDIRVPTPRILGHEFVGQVVDALHSDAFRIGDVVSCHPMLFGPSNDWMCGKDCDGCFAQYIAVPHRCVVKLDNAFLSPRGAFFEPLAAAVAPLKASLPVDKVIGVSGDNRIAQLMRMTLAYLGYSACCVDTDSEALYDCIIETEADKIPMLLKKLRKNGKLILKSRFYDSVAVCVNDIVMRDISLIGTSYGDLDIALKLLGDPKFALDDIFGDIFGLDQFQEAFELASQPQARKMFFEIN